eukprot:7988750-Prorocentrum_lima.AAC.1
MEDLFEDDLEQDEHERHQPYPSPPDELCVHGTRHYAEPLVAFPRRSVCKPDRSLSGLHTDRLGKATSGSA